MPQHQQLIAHPATQHQAIQQATVPNPSLSIAVVHQTLTTQPVSHQRRLELIIAKYVLIKMPHIQ